MRRRACLALCVALCAACSLLVPLDSLGPDASVTDGSGDAVIDATTDVADAAADADAALPDLTSCNALGLIAYYPMGEGEGGITYDCSPNHHFALLNGAYTWSTCGDAGCLVFTENDAGDAGSWGDDSDPAQLYDFPGSATVSLWIRVDRLTIKGENIVNKRAANNVKEGWVLGIDPSGRVSFFVFTAAATAPPIPLNTWVHVAAVLHAGTDITVYVSGVQQGSTPTDAGVVSNGNLHLFLAQYEAVSQANDQQFYGAMGDLRIFGRALDATEIAKLAGQ
jgi:hypothetical protein